MEPAEQIISTEEDWRGITDPVKRRKLQNRLNQRQYRRRRRENQEENQGQRRLHAVAQGNVLQLSRHPTATEICYFINATSFIDEKFRQNLLNAAAQAHKAYANHTPIPRHLPVVIKFNVFTALARNSLYLKLGSAWMSEVASSPFATPRPQAHSSSSKDLAPRVPGGVPASLRPTLVQTRIPHHPWLDLIPFPQMRDNIIIRKSQLALDDWEDTQDELCDDMCDLEKELRLTEPGRPEDEEERKAISNALEGPRFIVWGESWDANSWEASEDFIKKWGWMVKGCKDLMESTNSWRAKRGEPPLIWDMEVEEIE